MPGIVEQAMPPQQAAQPQPQKRQTSPETQRIVIAGKKILAQPEIARQIVQMMKAESDPATGIAKATVFLVRQILQKAKGAPPEAIIPAAQEILIDVAKVGAAAGLFKFSPELIGQAAKLAYQMGKELVTPQQAPQAQQPTPAAVPAETAQPEQMVGG